jgi:hypothetical protein
LRRTHLNGYLAADGIDLPGDVLDRIDEIVPRGVTINVADNMWDFGTSALTPAFRRREATSPGNGHIRHALAAATRPGPSPRGRAPRRGLALTRSRLHPRSVPD